MVSVDKLFPYISYGEYRDIVLKWGGVVGYSVVGDSGCFVRLGVNINYIEGVGSFIGESICRYMFRWELRYRLWLGGTLFGNSGDSDYYFSLIDMMKDKDVYGSYYYQGLFYPFLLVRDDFKDVCLSIIRFVCINHTCHDTLVMNGGINGEKLFSEFVLGGFDDYYCKYFGKSSLGGFYLFLMRRAIYMFFSYLYITNYGDFRNSYLNRSINSMIRVFYSLLDNEEELINICIIFK